VKALTIPQPWAAAIAHGSKRTENRLWPAPARHIGSRILIHAADAEDHRPGYGMLEVPQELADHLADWPAVHGAIIAVTTLIGCHYSSDGQCCGPWGGEGLYHWTLGDVQPLAVPVACKERFGFWTPSASVLAALAEAPEDAG
jgi:hypothetical protein